MKSERSRKRRRVRVRTPGGKTKIVYKKRKPSAAKCAYCGDVLKGVLRSSPSGIRKLAKTQRRPERPYGGVLCSKCMRKKLVDGVRGNV
jgi:large subunit ribosomal protein L34e